MRIEQFPGRAFPSHPCISCFSLECIMMCRHEYMVLEKVAGNLEKSSYQNIHHGTTI